jgi:flagellar protein FlbD
MRLTESKDGTDVIALNRLGGLPLAVNPDLIERCEHTPDTVITMVDGHKFVVVESIEQVVALVRDWRASVAAEALLIARSATAGDAADAADTDALGTISARLAPVLRLQARED